MSDGWILREGSDQGFDSSVLGASVVPLISNTPRQHETERNLLRGVFFRDRDIHV